MNTTKYRWVQQCCFKTLKIRYLAVFASNRIVSFLNLGGRWWPRVVAGGVCFLHIPEKWWRTAEVSLPPQPLPTLMLVITSQQQFQTRCKRSRGQLVWHFSSYEGSAEWVWGFLGTVLLFGWTHWSQDWVSAFRKCVLSPFNIRLVTTTSQHSFQQKHDLKKTIFGLDVSYFPSFPVNLEHKESRQK